VVWLSAFINSPVIRRDPEALWTWSLVPAARDVAILAGLVIVVLASIPLARNYYAINATMPAATAYLFAHEWLDIEDPEERGISGLPLLSYLYNTKNSARQWVSCATKKKGGYEQGRMGMRHAFGIHCYATVRVRITTSSSATRRPRGTW
jgi:hypothetical protein